MGLNERQIKAVGHVKEKGIISLSLFKTLVPEVSDKTLYRDLQRLVKRELFKKVGEKKGRKYKLL